MNVVLEDGRLVDSGEVAVTTRLAWPRMMVRGRNGKWMVAHPLVKTFSRDVFPQAPSPLSIGNGCQPCVQIYRVSKQVTPFDATHSKTSLRWTVLLPPSPQGMMSEMSRVRGFRREWRGPDWEWDRTRSWLWGRAEGGIGDRERRSRKCLDSIVDGCCLGGEKERERDREVGEGGFE